MTTNGRLPLFWHSGEGRCDAVRRPGLRCTVMMTSVTATLVLVLIAGPRTADSIELGRSAFLQPGKVGTTRPVESAQGRYSEFEVPALSQTISGSEQPA